MVTGLALGYGCNLHAVWDSAMLDASGVPTKEYVKRLNLLPGIAASIGVPSMWADESFRLAKRAWVIDGAALGIGYSDRWRQEMDLRLLFAGKRLAAILSAALVKNDPDTAHVKPGTRN
jgi:nuclease S1